MATDRLNQGAQLLQKAGSLTDIATELSVSPRVVSAWRAATKIPNETNQAKLLTAFGIPRRAWHEWTQLEPKPAAAPRVRTPERRLNIPEHCPWLVYGHPLGWRTARRLALADAATPTADAELDALDNECEELQRRHPGLVAACEAAELALGLALAAQNPDDECAAKFLRCAVAGARAHVPV